jgi:hypothetical protein
VPFSSERRIPVTATTAAILVLAGVAAVAGPAAAEVFHSRESALRLAFGEGAEVVAQELFLSVDARAEAARGAGSSIETRLVRRYEGRDAERLLGHAYFETHQVRTLPETLMVVVGPDGAVAAVHVLAFHEPEAYRPHPGFLGQFEGRVLDDELSLRGGVQGIAGSTFTATAVTAAVRRVLAVHGAVARDPREGGR